MVEDIEYEGRFLKQIMKQKHLNILVNLGIIKEQLTIWKRKIKICFQIYLVIVKKKSRNLLKLHFSTAIKYLDPSTNNTLIHTVLMNEAISKCG